MLRMEHLKVNIDLKSCWQWTLFMLFLPSLQLGEIGAGAGKVSDLLVVMKQATTGKTDNVNFLGLLSEVTLPLKCLPLNPNNESTEVTVLL